MMRRMDFRCDTHGVFEAVESLNAPVSATWPCPACGRSCIKVYLKAPMIGKISGGVFVTDFPGPIGADGKPQRITMLRDEVERRLAYKPEEKEVAISNLPERIERLMAKQDAGELPPAPEPTKEQRALIEKVLKPAV